MTYRVDAILGSYYCCCIPIIIVIYSVQHKTGMLVLITIANCETGMLGARKRGGVASYIPGIRIRFEATARRGSCASAKHETSRPAKGQQGTPYPYIRAMSKERQLRLYKTRNKSPRQGPTRYTVSLYQGHELI